MDIKDINTDQPESQWFIDLDWFKENNRSFPVVAQRCLCPQCRKQLAGRQTDISAADLLSTIKDCCSQTPGFITRQTPILESVFRFFLANGNQPLDLEELGEQLREWRGGDTYCTSVEILSRLLNQDQYYGLRQTHQPES